MIRHPIYEAPASCLAADSKPTLLSFLSLRVTVHAADPISAGLFPAV